MLAVFRFFRLLGPVYLFYVALSVAPSYSEERPNFLFIAIDDLNDFSGFAAEEPGNFLQVIYPDAEVRSEICTRLTPNLDKLARQSANFRRAYCASALCGPSRTSLMTGILPHESGYYMHSRHFRTYQSLAEAVTLPQHLKSAGYQTVGLGKLFHKRTGSVDGPLKNDWSDARYSWSQWINHPGGCGGGVPSKYSPPDGGLMQFGPSKLKLREAGDWLAADFAARLLETGSASTAPPKAQGRRSRQVQSAQLDGKQPFFLGCGIFRPHLPFFAPEKFLDKFPMREMTGLNRNTLEEIVSDLDDLPSGAQRFTDFRRGKLRAVIDHALTLGESGADIAAWREMTQAYLGCVAFADSCLGRLLEGYAASPHRENTVIVLWSDHGYHMGSKYHVAKQALWEEANRVQLLIHDPRNPACCDGRPRHQVVSLSDLYPTICDLAGVDLPPSVEAGTSLSPLLHDADAEQIHSEVLMTYQAGNHCIRTPKYRLMRYRDNSTELYDMLTDPQQIKNLAENPEHREVKEKLLNRLEDMVAGEVLPD